MSYAIPDAALEQDIAILGKKGRGKTYTAKGLVERLLDMGRRVIVLDPLSTWWGLKATASGKEGYPIVVFGGPHADVQLDDGMGRGLGRFLAAEHISAVIDLGLMRKAEQSRVVADLLEEMFAKNRDPVTLVLEEADAFAPQNPMGDGNTRVLGEVDRIARRGRGFGFRLISLTQRPAKIHKDVLTQLSTLIALGVTSPQDRDAIKAWVEGNADRDKAREVMDSLASLRVGEGWIWAPDLDLLKRVHFPKIKTLDTSATPKAGEKRIEPKRLAKADLTRIEEKLKKEIEPKKEAGRPVSVVGVDAEGKIYERGLIQGRKEGHGSCYAACLKDIGEKIAAMKPAFLPPAVEVSGSHDLLVIDQIPALERKQAPVRPKAAGELGAPARSMLEEAQRRFPCKFTWGQLAALTKRKARGGSFHTARKELIEGGHVYEDGEKVIPAVTEKRPAPSQAELLEVWISAMPAPANELLRVLASYPHPLSADELATRTNRKPTGGSWHTAISMLRSNGLIKEQARGVYVLGDLAT